MLQRSVQIALSVLRLIGLIGSNVSSDGLKSSTIVRNGSRVCVSFFEHWIIVLLGEQTIPS